VIYDNAAGIQVGSICTNCLVYNNTLYNNGTGSAVDADGKGTVVRNNIAYQSGSFINFGGATMHNNFTGDPGFTNIAARDFSLKPGSEARGAGDDGGDLGATPGRRGQSVPLAPRPAPRNFRAIAVVP
jgi:hypothetical protein